MKYVKKLLNIRIELEHTNAHRHYRRRVTTAENITMVTTLRTTNIVTLFVFLMLQPIVVVFSTAR
jgi:hypothetical protein